MDMVSIYLTHINQLSTVPNMARFSFTASLTDFTLSINQYILTAEK